MQTMEIKKLTVKEHIENDKKLSRLYSQFNKLCEELNKKELPYDLVDSINLKIDVINSFSGSNSDLLKQIRKTQAEILMVIEKELKLVTKNHYFKFWLAIGMTVFGIPLGVVFGTSLGNMAFIGIGIPIGLVLGIFVGTAMDKKAFEEGRQLEIEI